jgi:hypothetical protein
MVFVDIVAQRLDLADLRPFYVYNFLGTELDGTIIGLPIHINQHGRYGPRKTKELLEQ